MKNPLRWYWRVSITAVVTLLSGAVVYYFVGRAIERFVYGADWSAVIPYAQIEYVAKVFVELLIYQPLLLLCLGCYHFLTFRNYKWGETYCGHCRGLLKALTKPMCPHCGEEI